MAQWRQGSITHTEMYSPWPKVNCPYSLRRKLSSQGLCWDEVQSKVNLTLQSLV